MDGETIRLLATAAGVVLAGLGGALIAGWFNAINTRASIRAAALESSRQRDLEQAQWLRGRKVDVYTAFLDEARKLEIALVDANSAVVVEQKTIIALYKSLPIVPVQLVAPDQVNGRVTDLMECVDLAIGALVKKLQTSMKKSDTYDAAINKVKTSLGLVKRDMAEDLGIHWSTPRTPM